VTARARWPRIALTALMLAAVIGIAMTTDVDVRISDAIFAAGGGAWPLPHAGWTRALGYEGPKYALIAFALVLIAGLVRPSLLTSIHLERREAVFLLVCLALVPAAIGALRAESGIACASQLVRYGGDVPDWLGHFTVSKLLADSDLHGCFPSGHASGGFALLALGMLDRKPAARRGLWLFALLYGSWMGAYQLLRGAHFLSHVLASALIAQLVVSVLATFTLDTRATAPTGQASIPLVRHAQRKT
jgi:membrane-associated PAP2 superfamily phosphatase